MNLIIIRGLLIPFLGTSLGAVCVFFMKKELNKNLQRALTGFAAGVMVAASVWSLLIPSLEQSQDMGRLSFIPQVQKQDHHVQNQRSDDGFGSADEQPAQGGRCHGHAHFRHARNDRLRPHRIFLRQEGRGYGARHHPATQSGQNQKDLARLQCQVGRHFGSHF